MATENDNDAIHFLSCHVTSTTAPIGRHIPFPAPDVEDVADATVNISNCRHFQHFFSTISSFLNQSIQSDLIN